MSRWIINVLGTLSVIETQTGQVTTRFRTTKGLLLVGYLARTPGTAIPRELIGEDLWPNTEPSLQLKRLRYERTVVNAQLGGDFILSPGTGQLALSTEVESDLSAFSLAVQQVNRLQEPQARIAFLRPAVDRVLPLQEFLTGFFDDWVLQERQEFNEILRQALKRLVQELALSGQRLTAEQYVAKARLRFPDDPPILLPATLAPSYPPPPSNSTRWIGRTDELAALTQWKASPSRLITLTGTGGMGKTRLAREAFPEALFVSLAEARSAEQLWQHILGALGLPQQDDRSPEQQGLEALENHSSVFLILDNVEQLLPNIRASLTRLLEKTTRPRCIVTSRSPLTLPDEVLFRLEGLPPDQAESLFVDRARSIRSSFITTTDILAICRLLEGIPLALELAAARTLLLGPQQILEQLRLSLLKNRRAHPTDRHRSLHATIEWSVSLLPEPLRALFVQLSVFRGGFTQESVESCFAGALDDLEELYEHSLLEQKRDQDQNARYSLLTVIREFAEELRTTEETQYARQQHANYFTHFAKKIHEQEIAGGWDVASTQVLLEQENLHATIDHICKAPAPHHAIPLTTALFQLYFEMGFWEELDQLLTRCEEILSSGDQPTLQARCYGWRASLLRRQGKNPEAWQHWEKRLAIFEQLGNHAQILQSLWEMMGQAIDASNQKQASECDTQISHINLAEMEPGNFIVTNILRARYQDKFGDSKSALTFLYRVFKFVTQLKSNEINKISQEYNYAHYYGIPILINNKRFTLARKKSLAFIDQCYKSNQSFMTGYILLEMYRIKIHHYEILQSTKCLYTSLKIHEFLGSRLYSSIRSTFANFMVEYADSPGVQEWVKETQSKNPDWRQLYEDLRPTL